MARILVPTHLRTQDKFLVGLTLSQVLLCAVAVGAALVLWLSLPLAPMGRGGVALAVLVAGFVLALIQPGGRTLDDWAFILAVSLTHPRILRYRKGSDRWDD